MSRSPEVADVFQSYGASYRETHAGRMPLRQLRAMRALQVCRTATLGGHVDECEHCGTLRVSYNSCRNRHCPKCQYLDKERWLESRKKELLPIGYFHVVFTLPEQLRPIALRNQKVIYGLLFKAASETLKELTRDPKHLGAEVGFIAILHTWTQTLVEHPHIHCIVTGGGLSLDGKRWIAGRKKFFIRVEVLSRLFRGKFLYHLKEAYRSRAIGFPGQIEHLGHKSAFGDLLDELYCCDWVVHCKPSFKSAETVMEYLGRYTHRVAIGNERLVKLKGDRVTFKYRDSGNKDKIKLMSLEAHEFIRRFLLHILPEGFVKIRHYGILSNRNRKTKLRQCRLLLGVSKTDLEQIGREPWQALLTRITGIDPTLCPHCGKGKMVLKQEIPPCLDRAPP